LGLTYIFRIWNSHNGFCYVEFCVWDITLCSPLNVSVDVSKDWGTIQVSNWHEAGNKEFFVLVSSLVYSSPLKRGQNVLC
jgi:hypothetical protein